ncbi:vacuolar fusion protein mon1 [Cordyceps militaris CM01]|uniref:Vacuolar fusion protein MON1 n=2 Tax=Cordyceps militaris TaxID=73501 RepID=G3J5V6_CORMM|nr:vacuolar fusion protein mon1 [Cordyceps militaris CM01]ATY64603.1 vacuolar fusion mon1 [Cordyceps militaris]EGX96908.1 vacuolar fusion protein mon1 [Cordyceps militaris CM01]
MATDDNMASDGTSEASQPPSADSTESKLYTAQATTALTTVDIQTLSFPDGSRGTFQTPGARSVSTPVPSGYASPGYKASHSGGEGDDGASVMSFAPTMRPAGDIASLFVGDLGKRSVAWNMLRSQAPTVQPFETSRYRQTDTLGNFQGEFEAVPAEATAEVDDASRVAMWKAKLKHYMILSSAGKPIWSRHGDLMLINSSIGVMQTIISFYEGAKSPLLGFTAGDARFVVLTRGPLYFLAVSKLGESDSQLRAQLDALYMQILSTLTLPTLKRIFVHRPSSDLRKPLQGTESLLSSLADTFTRGSPTTLLGSLECLKLRKSQRHSINNTFLKLRADKLLYGLIIAGGKLVSVIRPRQHSLHPSDLQLIFNMLFESDGIKGGGGENWIPLCLPAFNNEGYLYMYVSFFDDEGLQVQKQAAEAGEQTAPASQQIAMVLISTDKESFFGLQKMRNDVAQQLTKNGNLAVIRGAVRAGRPRIAQIVPGNPISHFLYKSKANVQFCMAALEPPLDAIAERRRLMSLYHEMHAAVHAKHAHLKILHNTSEDSTSLAWVTPVFELYCVGGPNMSRATMGQGANKIIQWAKKEEQRLFIIGGGVF